MTPPVQQAPVREGDVLAGKYRVERVLGSGGMGVVVAATHLQLGQRVAVKFLLAEGAQDPESAERFLREARAAVRIQSEHVARVIDVGTLEGGEPYMVMEYLVGSDLSQRPDGESTLPIATAVDYVLQACEAIAEAHAQGIIHRDLKPANLFLTHRADGSPLIKVLDFGISKAINVEGQNAQHVSMTATTAVMGSPLYMSPEQLRSAKYVDVRTDIWSLGVILFELLTGRMVFEAESFPGLCAMIASDPAPRLRAFRPDAPEPLEAAITRCLEKNPAQRPQSIGELATLIAPFGSAMATVSAARVAGVLRETKLHDPGAQTQAAPSAPAPEALAPMAHAKTADAWGATANKKVQKRRLAYVAMAGVSGLALLGAAVAVGWSLAESRGSAIAPVAGASTESATTEGAPTPSAASAASAALGPTSSGAESASAASAVVHPPTVPPTRTASPKRTSPADTASKPPEPAKPPPTIDPLSERR